MISPNPENRFPGPTRVGTERSSATLPEQAPHYPLGFANVRTDSGSDTGSAATRRPLGFAPQEPADRPVFRTEISFRREPRPAPSERRPLAPIVTQAAQAGPSWGGTPTPGFEPVPFAPTPTWMPLASADGERVPFYRREITFRRRREEEPQQEPAAVETPPAEGASIADEPEVAHNVPETAEKVPFFKREIGFRRRRDVDEMPVDEPSDEVTAVELDDVPAPVDEPAAEPVTDVEPEDEAVAASVDEGLVAEHAYEHVPVIEHDHQPDHDVERDEPVAEEPVAEEPVAEEPVAEEPVAEEPVAEEPAAPASDPAPILIEAGNGRRTLGGRRGGAKPSPKRGGIGRGGRRVVGLKIGASQLAAAVITQSELGHELLQLARTPLESGVVVDGEVRDAAALTNALKAFFDEHHLPRRDVRIGLASNRIGVRTFDIVGIDDPERFDNAVRFKAHEVLPVAVHESVLDYRVLDERVSEAGEALRRVLLVVAPRDQVEPYLGVCRDAGLHLAGVDLETLGLLRAFVEPRPFASRTADDTATVVVAIGHEATTLLVSGGGAAEFTRVFDWGGAALQSAIAQELEIHPAEAATILRHLALSGASKPLASLDDGARGRALEAVRMRLTPFARELVSSLQFYQAQPESLGIGEIVITGGTSHLQGLGEALHQMIGVSVRVGDPLQRVVARTAFEPAIEATIGSLAVPIGLAIEDDALRSVDLMPRELHRQGRKRPSIVAVAAPVAAVAAVAALAFTFAQASGDVSDREAQLGAVRADIAALPEPKRPTIDAGVAATEVPRATALASVLGGRLSWDDVLRDLSLVLPGNVSLTHLLAQVPPQAAQDAAQAAAATTATAVPAAPTGVRIEGYTVDQPAVARLLLRLRTVPSLVNVTLESSKVEVVAKTPIVRFAVLADLNQPGGAR